MEIFIIVTGLILNAVAIIGCIMPIVPGPLLSLVSVVISYFYLPNTLFGTTVVIVCGVVAFILAAMDYFVPIVASRKFGASKQGIYGGMIGMILGMIFFNVVGLLVGTFLGTIAGDLYAGQTFKNAYRAGIGSFIGFFVSTFLKLSFCIAVFIAYIIDGINVITYVFGAPSFI